jgi:hypothetical protein
MKFFRGKNLNKKEKKKFQIIVPISKNKKQKVLLKLTQMMQQHFLKDENNRCAEYI